MGPGPTAINLESYNPLDAKFTMKKGVSKVCGKWSTLVTCGSFSSNRYTEKLLRHSALGDSN